MADATLVWTRSIADWSKDKTLLAKVLAGGKSILHIPCLETRAKPFPIPDRPAEIVAFTSANAVRFALKNPAFLSLVQNSSAIYTFGEQTAIELKSFGVPAILAENVRTAPEFGDWLENRLAPGTELLLPGAVEMAFDLVSKLKQVGINARHLPCYQTVIGAKHASGRSLTEAEVKSLTQSLTGVLCLASPSAVAGFCKVFSGMNNTLRAVAIGPTTAHAAEKHFARVEIADDNSLAALVDKALGALV